MTTVRALVDGAEKEMELLGELHAIKGAPARELNIQKRVTIPGAGAYWKSFTAPLYSRQVLEEAGLDGLEARYATYDRQWEALADSLAAERGLLRSGGSDFHGDRKPNRLGEGLGQLFVPVAWAEKPGD